MFNYRISALVLLATLVAPSAGLPQTERAMAASTEMTIGARAGRHQFNAVGSGSLVVWEDRAVFSGPTPRDPKDDATRGSSDIWGLDVSTNRPFVVTDSPGDQTSPAISGSLVVWMDTAHSCPTCESDIRGKDLARGAEFVVASGPTDQAAPAIEGRAVAWVETFDTQQRLLLRNLDSSLPKEISKVATTETTIQRPVMSADLVVWAEDTGINRRILRAYDRQSGGITTVAGVDLALGSYAVSGRRIVWTDPQLWLTDLTAKQTTLLDEGRAIGAQIDGTQVAWQALEDATGPGIYGMELAARRPLLLRGGTGYKRGVRLVGNTVVWVGQDNGEYRVRGTDRSQAFAQGVHRPARAAKATVETMARVEESEPVLSALYTRPTYKGIHAANAWGWQGASYGDCSAVSALHDANGVPYFGSIVVLESDVLNTNTGCIDSWGSSVNSIMRTAQTSASYPSRVIVRIFPNTQPIAAPSGNTIDTPEQVAQNVISLATAADWVRHIQVNNEPNIEWASSCTNCTWLHSPVSYTWSTNTDVRKYQAINDFYNAAWYKINYYASNHNDPTVRSRIAQMERWTPAMADVYDRSPDGSVSMYTYLWGMINLYGKMTYHTYIAPNWDSDPSGGVYNNSWEWGFDSNLRNAISGGTIRTMITEFGWNPGQMTRCVYSQTSYWRGDGTSYPRGTRCSANVGNHTFNSDINYFLANQRHSAEVVAVWLVNGHDGRANAITGGIPHYWLEAYQQSSP